jgi:hypothetical protein
MSMPQYFRIAVVSYEDREIASIVTAILGWPPNQMSPCVVPVCALDPGPNNNNELITAGYRYGLRISETIDLHLLEPEKVDLWIALDERAEFWARSIIEKAGPTPQNFYRAVFPDPVVQCGFHVPSLQENNNSYKDWLEKLKTLFSPWKWRLWEAFCDSS